VIEVEKQEIRDLLFKLNTEDSEDSKVVQAGKWFVNISIFVMIYGISIWVILLFPGLITAKPFQIILTFFSSSIVGITLFCYSLGLHLFNNYHIKGVSVSWHFNGIARTLLQCYYWSSIIILISLAQNLFTDVFFIVLILFYVPVHIGYILARTNLIRNKIETYLLAKYNL
jgi:hypothetical protein